MARDLEFLFHHNPPDDPDLQRQLFQDRIEELQLLRARLLESRPASMIRAIHGESRVGKSHLVRRLLLDVDEAAWHVFDIDAAKGRRARRILEELYRLVRTALDGVDDPAELAQDDQEGTSTGGILRDVKKAFRDIDELVTGVRDSVKIRTQTGSEQTAGLGLILKFFNYQDTSKASDTRVREYEIKAPDDYRLVGFILELAETLELTTGKRVLIYLDDVDLLDAGSPDESDEVTNLLRLLKPLAASPKVEVVASLRTRQLSNKDNELSEAVRVRELKPTLLRAIVQQHIDAFHDGRAIFDERCIEELLKLASGKPGNLLRNCRKMHDWAFLEGRIPGRLLNVEDLADFLREDILEMWRTPECRSYLRRIADALRGDRPDLTVSLDRGVLRTNLIFTVLEEPATLDAREYFVNGVAAPRVLEVVPDEGEADGTARIGVDNGTP